MQLGGFSGIGAGVFFFIGVILQITNNWFPEEALQSGEMVAWLKGVGENLPPMLVGVGFSIIGIFFFFSTGFSLNRLHPKGGWLTSAAFCGHVLGTTLAMCAFVFGFGFTWGLSNLANGAAEETLQSLSTVATMGMRGFLAGDDVATTLIGGVGNGLFSLAALRSGYLPKWLCWLGIITGILIFVVLLRYFVPALVALSFAYPMIMIWFICTGVILLKKARA